MRADACRTSPSTGRRSTSVLPHAPSCRWLAVAIRGSGWWVHTARWARLTISASIAAGIALVAVIRLSPKDTSELAATGMVATNSDQTDETRAAFESAVVGRSVTWTIDSALMPSATDLLIPLGTDGASR